MIKIFSTDPYFLKLQKKSLDDLRKCWGVKTNTQPVIAVADIDAAHLVARMQSLDIKPLPGKDELCDGFVFEKRAAAGQPECWVSVREQVQYRKIYLDFLKRYFDFPEGADLDGSIHVDHVFSRKRAERSYGLGYVRVTLAKGDVNSTFGRNWELHEEHNRVATFVSGGEFGCLEDYTFETIEHKNWPPQPVPIGSAGQMRYITWPLATKAFGIRAPAGKVTTDYIIETLRELVKVDLIKSADLRAPFGLYASVFRMGTPNLPHYDGQSRAKVKAITADGRELTEKDAAETWLMASLKSEC